MLKTNQLNYIIRLLLDILVMALSFFLANYFETGFFEKTLHGIDWGLFAVSVLIWYACGRIFFFYREIAVFSFSQEMVVFFRQLATHLLLIVFVIYLFFSQFTQNQHIILYYHGCMLLLIPLEKFLFRSLVAAIRNQYKFQKNILIVGAGSIAANFYRTGILNNDLRYNLQGIVDDYDQKNFNARYLGKVEDLPAILDKTPVDEVFLALPSDESQKIEYVIDLCEKYAKRVNVLQDIMQIGKSRFDVPNYAGFPVVGIRYFPLDDAENRFFKRLFDLVFSTLFLICLYSWLYPLIALAIKLSSKGPVLFKQERYGLNNKKIICYKFRTMYVDKAEDGNGNGFRQAKRNDARVTTVGRFLRKTSLDEIPQFVNVFIGNMSVVGPRPHPIPLSLESQDIIHNYMLRHLVKPGITGWAQVNGSRGETSQPDAMRKRVALDLWYIQNWSFWLDNQIILQTVINLIKGDENAY